VRQRGFSLPELMVALTIGVVLTGAFVAVLERCRRESASNDSLAQLQESARHALDMLVFDLEHAGFFAGADLAATRLVRGGVLLAAGDELRQPDPASPRLEVAGLPAGAHDCGSNFVLDLELAVQGANGRWPASRSARDCEPTRTAGGARAEADTLTVRHASLGTTSPLAGRLQMYTRKHESHAGGVLFADGIAPGVLDADAEIRDVEVRSYYVANNAVARSGWPALRVKELTESGGKAQFRDEELMPGVEDLQVEIGLLDVTGGSARISFVPADSPLLRELPAIAVRLWLRLRADTTEHGYLDTRSLHYADVVFRPDASEASQRRLLVQRTVRLRNVRSP
jgi:type IV pilus assembly protein PilW